jgi:hypothetical protein
LVFYSDYPVGLVVPSYPEGAKKSQEITFFMKGASVSMVKPKIRNKWLILSTAGDEHIGEGRWPISGLVIPITF